ncbi:hypothetical protein BGX24_010918 [Mortierella sp. AD032]|nr:hypothetical protein BGX24_010918 [Mortierella sp. AD032]
MAEPVALNTPSSSNSNILCQPTAAKIPEVRQRLDEHEDVDALGGMERGYHEHTASKSKRPIPPPVNTFALPNNTTSRQARRAHMKRRADKVEGLEDDEYVPVRVKLDLEVTLKMSRQDLAKALGLPSGDATTKAKKNKLSKSLKNLIQWKATLDIATDMVLRASDVASTAPTSVARAAADLSTIESDDEDSGQEPLARATTTNIIMESLTTTLNSPEQDDVGIWLISVDIEAYESNQALILEIGWSICDPSSGKDNFTENTT